MWGLIPNPAGLGRCGKRVGKQAGHEQGPRQALTAGVEKLHFCCGREAQPLTCAVSAQISMYARLSEHDHISVLFLCHSENRNALLRITFSSIKVTRKNRPKICYYNLSMKLLSVRGSLFTLWENYNRNSLSSLMNAMPAGVYISECVVTKQS